MTAVARRGGQRQWPFEITPGLRLVPGIVHCGGNDPVGEDEVGRGRGPDRNGPEAIRHRLRPAKLATGHVVEPQCPEGDQLIVQVAKLLGKLQSFGEHLLGPGHQAGGEDERQPQCDVQPHAETGRQRDLGSQVRQCMSDPFATLHQQRQMQPGRDECGGEGDAGRGVAVGGKSPVERHADVVDLPHVGCHALRHRLGFGGRAKAGQQDADEGGVALCDEPGLTLFGQLFERVGPGCLQQPPSAVRALPVGDDQ